MVDLSALVSRVSELAARIAGKPDLRWATVTAADPIQIRFDAEVTPLAGTPSTLVAGLEVGDRAMCAVSHRRVTILGKGGGSDGVPSGAIMAWPTTTPPEGWLLCDATAISRAAYADLFAVLGETYGAGDGSTTFNKPDLRQRVPVGRLAGDSDFGTLGNKGGAKTHTLTTAQMPSHTHPGSGQGFWYGSGTLRFAGGSTYGGDIQAATGAAGSGGAHNNLQPFIVLNYIIKI